MTNKVTMKSLHIRNGDNHRGMWQAWDGENYLAGANGPMSLQVMGVFLDFIFEERHKNGYDATNAGVKWLPDLEERIVYKVAQSK